MARTSCVFDGASLVVAADGSLVASAAQFTEQVLVVDVEVDDGPPGSGDGPEPVLVSAGPRAGTPDRPRGGVATLLDPEAEVYEALVLGTRDYVAKNGFTDAVIGLSGGIDSSLVAAVAVDALGPGHVHGVTMPSRYSSERLGGGCGGPGRQPGHRYRHGGHRARSPGLCRLPPPPVRAASPWV